MKADDFDIFDRAAEAARRKIASTTPDPDLVEGDGAPAPRHRVKMDAAGASLLGLADTVTFGFLDEAGSFLDSSLPTWLGGTGESYEEALRRNRGIVGQARDEHSAAYTTGAIGGAFVPVLGWGGRVKSAFTAGRVVEGAAGMALAGAAQGALYGFGSADGDLTDRLVGAAGGGIAGGVGGYVLGATVIPATRWAAGRVGAAFRWGRLPAFEPKFKFNTAELETVGAREGEELAAIRRETAGTPADTPKAPSRGEINVSPRPAAGEASPLWNDLTGAAGEALEKDAVLTSKELFGMSRTAAQRAILDRIAKLTPQQAERIAHSLEDAELTGDLLKDPHYRSLLGIDLSNTDMDEATMTTAARIFEDATKALVERAGMGKRTTKSIDAEMRDLYGKFSVESDLDAAIERTARAATDGRLGTHHMAMAAMQFARAKDKYLPLIMQGDKEAREKLAEELTTAIRVSAKGRIIASNLGRGLGDMSRGRKLAFTEMKDGVAQIEDAASIKARVDSALKELGDTDLAELLSRVRGLGNLEEVEEVLLNADHAKDLSAFRRSVNSLGLYLKSNSLTPASGIFNTVGFVLHDLFRNGWAKQWAARGLELAGETDEAMKLRFELSAQNRVYWEAHRRGLKAMLNRIQWEWWDSVEKIAGVAKGDSKVALKASTSKLALLQEGYEPPAIREFDKMGRAAVTDVRAFNERINTMRSEGGAFANLVATLQRAGAATLNTTDALGTATARLVSGALDDWGSTFVRVKETYALAARQAMTEALASGLPQEEMASFASKRAQALAEMPTSDILQSVNTKLLNREELTAADHFLLNVRDQADKEASRVLFMDGPQTVGGRWAAQGASMIDKAVSLGTVQGLLMRYIRTPTRIFERGLVSYTPWGHMADEVQSILTKGGIEAEVEKARMEIGAFVMGIGAMAAASGAITLTNGGWKNSANLKGAPPNRLNLPNGGHVELSRLDPFALTLAIGGFIGQAVNAYQHDRGRGFEAEEALHTAFSIGWMSIRESVLEKSYLTGLRDVMKGAFADDGDSVANAYAKMLAGAFTNVTPFAGTVRQVNDTIHGSAPEAVSWIDKLLRAVPGMEQHLPARIDALGDPVDGRTMGVDVDLTGPEMDPVKAQLADLGVDLGELGSADPAGFRLTSDELSELRRIRGHEAVNADGETMREALQTLFADPTFRALRTREQRQDAVTKTLSGFNEDARAIFEDRNPNYRADREANKALIDYMAEGLSPDRAKEQATADVTSEGLPAPTRL